MKVLLVDDEPFVIGFLAPRLEREGYEVIVAYDGSGAADKLFPDGELDPTIQAVITDCRMTPGKSGLWLLQYLHERREHPPCLLHSSSAKYREAGREINLKDVPKVFPFAQFHQKDAMDLSYISDFLSGIEA